ncbi:uncharacterized protein LOC131438824 [Malaya genurostris]|uniref:uncharacterized protein LOC131438824 n=1 Tax=Malaya genurostris TaxID=325434 RepID=UPI0026F3FDD6|nr:uncharacterized protein LOC131438824 [Malaya genurostris]
MFGNQLLSRTCCSKPAVTIYQNLFASKPSIRNRPKVDNFKSYEILGKIKQFIFRDHSCEKGLGPIPCIDESAKCGIYKNPEYFCYHNYTYYDFMIANKCNYLPQPSATGGCLPKDESICSETKEVPADTSCPPPSCAPVCVMVETPAQGTVAPVDCQRVDIKKEQPAVEASPSATQSEICSDKELSTDAIQVLPETEKDKPK